MTNHKMKQPQEYILPEGELLISTTDLLGNITYADDNFIRVSGFSNKELIGQPHNIVRHPDMPKEAFIDLWECISAGRGWSGIIKNKQKEGGFYWVKSDVAMRYEDGEPIGFMSVRSCPNRDEVKKAEASYKMFKLEEQGNKVFKDGKIVEKQRKGVLSGLSIKQRITGLTGITAFAVILLLGISIFSINSEKKMVDHLYNSHIEGLSQIMKVESLWRDNHYLLGAIFDADTHENKVEISQVIRENNEKLQHLEEAFWRTFQADHEAEEEHYKHLFRQGNLLVDSYLKEITHTITLELDEEATVHANTLIRNSLKHLEKFQVELKEAVQGNKSEAKDIYITSQAAVINEIILLCAITFIFLIVLVIRGYLFNQDIQLRLQSIKRYFKRLEMQDFLFDINVENKDEIADVLQSLKRMKVQLAFNMKEVQQQADAATRIKVALDNVSTNVMIADNGRNIIYANPAVIDMLKNAEKELKEVIPGFDVEGIVGTNIDQFHKNPSHQEKLLATFKTEHRAQAEVNGRIFALVANPVINEHGERLGSVTEWTDRTLEVAVEKEIESVIQAAVNGDFTQRMGLEDKNIFLTTLCENINRLLEVNELSLTDVVEVLTALSEGDLTAEITAEYAGAFGQLKDSSNLTVSKLKEMILQIKITADTINTAAKEIAIGNVDLSQRTERQACSLEVTSSSMEELTTTVKQNSENAKQANELASKTSINALSGGEIVNKVVNNMSEINTSSRKIMDIISVIDSIAFQTNILALNAAVEAARAGEQGRGFAVVATEVRNLAQRSAAAAKEVKTLINTSVEKIEVGAKLADQAGNSIAEVVGSIQEVAKLINGITTASIEQSVGIDQVSRAIMQMDDVTQQNAALVEEGSAAASSLEEQVANLAISVAAFDTGEASFVSNVCSLDTGGKTKGVPKISVLDDNDWSEF